MNLSEMRKMLDSRRIGAAELTREYLDRIHADTLGCYITVCEESALAEAEKAQRLIDSGRQTALTGIPLSVKDNICTLGIKTTCASKMLADFVPHYDATAVARLKSCGAVILGKTNMDEFGMGGSSQTSYFGGVKNPYNRELVAGGSSGGAAAAVATDLCAAALGTDTGGSVRQPAAFCGVTGIKPTYGTVSRYGLIAFASSLDQIGVIAKSAHDTGLVLNAICGHDNLDRTTAKHGHGDMTALVGSSLKGLKIGIPAEFFSDEISDEVKTAVLAAAEQYRSMGCELYDVSLASLEYAVSAYYLISSAEAASNLARFDGIRYGHRSDKGADYLQNIMHTRTEGFGDEVKRRILLGNYALSGGYYDEYYKKAQQIKSRMIAEYDAVFEKCDVILTPTSPTSAAGYCSDDAVGMYLADVCTVGASIAGLPAISTTCGYDSAGMPMGMSITGRRYDEKTIIAVADMFERDFVRKEAVL